MSETIPDCLASPADTVARAELAQAIVTLGRLLPAGMQVLIYHPEGKGRAACETIWPDGSATRYWIEQAFH